METKLNIAEYQNQIVRHFRGVSKTLSYIKMERFADINLRLKTVF